MESWPVACISMGMRIPPSATTGILAGQPSAQSVLAGDSFAVILGAASEEPVSVQPVVASLTKEQTGQDTSSRGAGKQTEGQSPTFQGTRSSRAGIVRSSNDRSESDIDKTSGGRLNFNPPVDKSLSVTIGRNWAATLNGASLPPPVISTVSSTTTSTLPLAARTTWTASTILAPSTGLAQQPKSSAGSASSGAQVQSDVRVVNRKPDGQSGPQLLVMNEDWNANAAMTIPQPTQANASDAEKLPEQLFGSSPSTATSNVVARTSTLPAATAPHGLPQPAATPLTTDVATPTQERGQSSQIPPTAAKPVDASIDADSATPATGNGLQVTVATPHQPAATQERGQSSQTPPTAAKPVDATIDADSATPVPESGLQITVVPPHQPAVAQERGQFSQIPPTAAKPADPTIEVDSATPAAGSGLQVPVAAPLQPAAAQMVQESLALPIAAPFLAMSSTVSSKGTAVDALSNATQKTSSNAVKSANSDLASAASTGASKTKDDASGSGDSSAHTNQNAQTDASQGAVSTPKVQDLAVAHSQAQTVASTTVTHEAIVTARGSDAPASMAHLDAAREAAPAIDPERAEAMTTSGVNAAKLVQAMSESEMHIGLSSTSFGDISIRTSITNHQMLAQISLDHSELSQAISAHVSTVQGKLSDDYGMHASIEVNNLPSSHAGEPGNSSQRERGNGASSLPFESAAVQGEENNSLGHEVLANAGDGSRLDIRA